MKYEISNIKYEKWNMNNEIRKMKLKCEEWNMKYKIIKYGLAKLKNEI
jgi:hypothetical protein